LLYFLLTLARSRGGPLCSQQHEMPPKSDPAMDLAVSLGLQYGLPPRQAWERAGEPGGEAGIQNIVYYRGDKEQINQALLATNYASTNYASSAAAGDGSWMLLASRA